MGVLLESKTLSSPSKRLPAVQTAWGLIRLTGPGSWTGLAERVHHGGWRGMRPTDRTLAQPPLARVPLESACLWTARSFKLMTQMSRTALPSRLIAISRAPTSATRSVSGRPASRFVWLQPV